ncbi:MAG: TerB family tellurite resistance protein [Deltaproteobacteria bacterium]|nr:TerB family tellurite resistance protein [Deltaproteobacteria bacterium]MBW2201252.1 TerB family tellurite resistance protein [Deltaproteobacteria bacterium]MBW2539077.1 TerB family tellurite resistance protein [Deltaproteobacteria bacterium]
MGWLGKVVGGTIGFALGGPLGAIAGAAFGHAFDQSHVNHDYREVDRLSSNEETQLTFFVAAFSMLAKLTKADGHITKEEIDSIENFMVYDLNLSPESRRVAVNIFQTATDSRESFQDFAAQFYNQFRFQPQILEFMIDILLRVSLADGALSENEEKLIFAAARMFTFSDQEYRKIKSRHVKEVVKFYAVLGCKSNDSDDQIKKQYRKLVMEYHPDTIASKGLPEEFTKFAEDKFREIHEAYEAIKKERGI